MRVYRRYAVGCVRVKSFQNKNQESEKKNTGLNDISSQSYDWSHTLSVVSTGPSHLRKNLGQCTNDAIF